MSSVLVTGCNGYIGSHVVKQLAQDGHQIEGWDIDIYGDDHNDVSQYLSAYHHMDVNKIDFCHDEFDAVVHLGGLSVVPQSMKTPTAYYETNVIGTRNMFKHITTPHFLFASTSSAWEMASPYARSKVAAEDVIKEHADGYTIFRFFNVSGTDGRHRQIGPATHLIRVAAEAAAGKREGMKIYGTDYDTRDGTCIRDYVHVCDLASAIAEAVLTGPRNTDYECLGSNTGYSVREVIAKMKEVTGVDFKVEEAGRRAGDAIISVVDELSPLIHLSKKLEDMCLDQYNLERKKNYA